MNDEEIKHCIGRALHRLLGEQPPLDFPRVHERSTGHRLAVQMQTEFPGWNIDCEYESLGTKMVLSSAFHLGDRP